MGPQASCTSRTGSWGTASWTLDADCTLTINGGDTGSLSSATVFGSYGTTGTVAHDTVDILIKGDLTMRANAAFWMWPSLTRFRMAPGARFAPTGDGGNAMFYSDTQLTSVDTQGWDVSQSNQLSGMFTSCTSLTSISMKNLNATATGDFSGMFYNCTSLTKVDMTGLATGDNKISNASSMFKGDTALTTVILPNLHLASGAYLSEMFKSCTSLATLDMHGWQAQGSVTGLNAHIEYFGFTGVYVSGLLHDCTALATVDAHGMRFAFANNWLEAFREAPNIAFLNLAGLAYVPNDLSGTVVTGVSSSIHYASLLAQWTTLKSIDVSGWDTSHLTSMNGMFTSDPNLTSIIGLKDWDTTGVTSMNSMFSQDTSLTSVDVSHFDTSHVTTMRSMFQDCHSLASVDASHFDTSHVTNTGYMFQGCHSLVDIDVTGFDTRQVTFFGWMFADCPNLTVLNPSGFDITHTNFLSWMFDGDTNLRILDLSGWDTSQLLNFGTSNLLPSGLRMLALGPNTKLQNQTIVNSGGTYPNSFAAVDQSIQWDRMAGFQPHAAFQEHIGTTPDMAARAASANPAGYYTDRDYKGATVVADANGGAGWSIQDYDTTSSPATLSAPEAGVLTGHKPHSVFTGWNTKRDGTGTPYQPGQAIDQIGIGEYFPHGVITLYAQWGTVQASTTNPAITYHHTGDTIQVTGTAAGDGSATACLNPTTCQTTTTTAGGAWTIGFPTGTFTGLYPIGTVYTVTVNAQAHDPTTNTTVTGPDTTLTGTLPWTTTTLSKDGATGSVPTVPNALTDTGDNKAYPSLPRLAATGGISVAGGYLTGWNHQTGQSTAEYTTPGATAIPTTDGTTDSNGHTSVTLHPVWNILNAPTGAGRRSPADNGVRFTATGQPWTNTDTITLCVKPHTQPAYTDCTTPTTTSGWTNGDYTINKDYTSTQLPQGGQYDIKTTLTTPGTTDTWRGDGTTQTGTLTKSAETTVRISNAYQSSLPMTGGRPQRLATLLATGLALALLLLAAANRLRHQRQAKARHSR
ncbi:BspA family leucine-rich repeat surface protein [Bifidobacterium sp. ESL0775]|uniref:BspA family leucine-rich repeat surface protein n=1 Tax=Bifidobacterium sp. ESL0775 TaxID=2983230 RepID=UPI0023F7699D|nr:BspA family leucine-rich repeat surface protein [Bifidobacterium sp. ESL0775]WEV68474.1 BspA family leucine-rich repeat surface protein [Bifidobacterium sp. ESL0775]